MAYDMAAAGALIRARREALGLSQHALALLIEADPTAHCAVTQGSVSAWELGKQHVALRNRGALVRALHMTSAELFG